jgi:hypothetical protein
MCCMLFLELPFYIIADPMLAVKRSFSLPARSCSWFPPIPSTFKGTAVHPWHE